MRRFAPLAVLALLSACTTYTAPYSESQPCDGGSCTRAAKPTTTAEGMSLVDVDGFRLVVCAANGQTLSGAGTINFWLYDHDLTNWAINSELTKTIGTSASGNQCTTVGDLQVGAIDNGGDLVVPYASGVTVSGGSSVTVHLKPHRAH